MAAYALAHMHSVEFGPQIIEYLEKIDATLDLFGGRFLVHGNPIELIEGSWDGNLIIIEFPDLEHVRAWYNSPEYQAILRLRTDNSVSDTLMVGGVPDSYRGADSLAH
jgi:uncharacterized protein (DUF1330 family)